MQISPRLSMVAAVLFVLLNLNRSVGEVVAELSEIRISPDAVEKKVPHAAMRGIQTQKSIFLLGNVTVAERLFYENGQVAEEKMFHDGRLHGVWTQFYESGKPFSQRPFRNGLADGIFRFWGADGQALGQSRMVRGSGVLREYGLVGLESQDAEAAYANGRIHGYRRVWGRFHRGTGRGVDIAEFKEGEPNGWSATFDEDGTQLGSAYYRDGQLYGVMRAWNRDGTMLNEYPKFHLEGSEVPKVAFDAAAQTDALLQESLKNDGSHLKGIAFSDERLQSFDESSKSSPNIEPAVVPEQRIPPRSVTSSRGTGSPQSTAVTSEHQPPALTREEREHVQRTQLWKSIILSWPWIAVVMLVVVVVVLVIRRTSSTSR